MKKSKKPSKVVVKKASKLKPMNPIQTARAIASVERLYDKGDAKIFTDDWRDAQMKRIAEASKLWGESND
jgi:hypothetical protein